MQANDGPMATVFAAPGKYIQGRGATGKLGEVLEQLGSDKPLVLSDPIVEEIMGGALEGLRGRRWSNSGESVPRRR
jgi:glycerol dehydrogenase